MSIRKEEMIPTRASLLGRLKDWNDEKSWNNFYRTYWRLIYSFALNRGLTESEARDAVQETLLAVARKMERFEYDPARSAFKTWLLSITHKKIVDQFRRRERPASNGPATSGTGMRERVADPHVALERIWDAEWEKHLIAAALEQLKPQITPRRYQVFYLHVIKGQSTLKVARALGVAAGQVYLVKHRVLPLFRKTLKNLQAQAWTSTIPKKAAA